MRCFVILADINGTRLDPPRVVRRSTHGSCDCRYAGAAHAAPGAPRLYTGKGAKRLNPLLAARGPQRALEPLPNPRYVQNVKMTPNAK